MFLCCALVTWCLYSASGVVGVHWCSLVFLHGAVVMTIMPVVHLVSLVFIGVSVWWFGNYSTWCLGCPWCLLVFCLVLWCLVSLVFLHSALVIVVPLMSYRYPLVRHYGSYYDDCIACSASGVLGVHWCFCMVFW